MKSEKILKNSQYSKMRGKLHEKIVKNHARYLDRVEFYLQHGYNLEKERIAILEHAKPIHGPILEIGTGKGHFALILAKKKYQFTSIDLSAEDIEITWLNLAYKGLQTFADLKVQDAEQLSFFDKSFNLIFSINVLHHLLRPYIVLEEMIRVLLPTGKIVVSDFTEEGMEIVNGCHVAEGRRHVPSGFHIHQVEVYFINRGFTVNKFTSRCQHTLIIQRVRSRIKND
ncbi:MAG: class I SAM-dependent methyltransferase [bacterium]